MRTVSKTNHHTAMCGSRPSESWNAGYFPVKVRCLVADTEFPCDVFHIEKEGSGQDAGERLLERGSIITRKALGRLKGRGIYEVYLGTSDEDRYLAYLSYVLQSTLDSSALSVGDKAALLLENAFVVLNRVTREEPNKCNLRLGLQFCENCFLHLQHTFNAPEELLSCLPRDFDLPRHSVRVMLLGMLFCKFLGWDKKRIKDFGLGALFHDIGKHIIQERILGSASAPGCDRFEILKKHPVAAYQQLSRTAMMTEDQLRLVLSHHEALDGSGYPEGLKGDEIHEYARVAHIINVYDRLISKGTSGTPLAPSVALQFMNDEMSRTLDPVFVEAFSSFLGFHKKQVEEREWLIKAQLGNEMVLSPLGKEYRFVTTLVGMEAGRFLILMLPEGEQLLRNLFEKEPVIVRYVNEGTVYGFRSVVLGRSSKPFRLLFIAYPKKAESLDLRKHLRVGCFIPTKLQIDDELRTGAILDLSPGGCKFVLRQGEGGVFSVPKAGGDVIIHTHFIGDEDFGQLKGKLRNIRIEDGKYELGIQFIDLSPGMTETLEKFIEKMLVIAA